eukprot:IDg5496t1
MSLKAVQLATQGQGLDPENDTTALYGARADASCYPVHNATTFAIGQSGEEQLTSFYELPVPLKL